MGWPVGRARLKWNKCAAPPPAMLCIMHAGQEADYAFTTLDRDFDGWVTEEVRLLSASPPGC